MSELEIGRTLAHYEIVEKIGEGGMGAPMKSSGTPPRGSLRAASRRAFFADSFVSETPNRTGIR